MRGLLVAEVALVVVATAAGALVYGGFFATAGYLPVVGLACLAGAGTAAVAAARRCTAWATTLVAAGGFALFATYAVFGDTVKNGLPTGRTASALRDGIGGGWARMLSVEPPADVWDELLVTPVLVVWVAAFAAVTLTMRSRSLLAPVAPPLVAFVLALLAAGDQPGGHTAATVAFLTAAVALILIRAHPRRAVGLTIAAAVLFGIAGGQVLPLASGQHRFDPRDLRPPPITLTDTLTPLAMLKPQLTANPPRALFTLRINQKSAPYVGQVRTAALDAFNGTTWTTTDTFRVAGSHLATDPELTNARTVTARLEVKELPGPFLPVLGWPSRFAATQRNPGDTGFNARSGVLVSTAPMLRGLRYELDGKISSRQGLPLAVPSTSPALARYRALPTGTPSSLLAMARQHVGAQPTPYAQLTELARYLRAHRYSLSAPPGHSYAAITRLLTDDPASNSGYAEQYASAFTVLARALGYPARVAVGYRLRDYRAGAYTVTTADAHAWPEVHFAGYGWVSFEPTDTSNTSADPPAPPPEIPRVVPPRSNPPVAAPAAEPPPDVLGNQAGFDWTGVVRGTAILVIGGVMLVACVAAVITAEKARRRWRRRHAHDPPARVLGAWQELIDRLTEQGIAPPVSLTAQEVAQHADKVLGPAARSVGAVAPLATVAVFDPGQLDQRAAEQAWHLAARLHAELYPRRLSVKRLRAAVDPRPLWTGWRAVRDRRRAWLRLTLGRYG